MRRFRIFSLLTCLFLTGCLQENPEELERLTKEDPSFKQMIVLRDQVHGQIQLIKQDLLNRKKLSDTQVEKIRTEYEAIAKQQNNRVEQLRGTIDQNKELIKRDIERGTGSLEAKINELDGYQKTLSDVKKVLNEGKGISLSKTERQKWEERTLMLAEKMRPLSEEIQELKLQIRLKKQKIQYLK